jgi:hypothetical protein
MAYSISGTYVASCDCRLVCPCPVDGTPTGPNDQCHGAAVFRIDRGSLDDVELGGTSFALLNYFPGNISSGNWAVSIVVNEGATDDQAKALETIVSGQAGGPFAEFAPLIAEYKGMSRGAIEVSEKGAKIGGVGNFTYDQLTGPDGGPTVTRNAMFGFVPEFRIGRTSGSYKGVNADVNASYGESGDFEYTSEMTGEIHPRA